MEKWVHGDRSYDYTPEHSDDSLIGAPGHLNGNGNGNGNGDGSSSSTETKYSLFAFGEFLFGFWSVGPVTAPLHHRSLHCQVLSASI